MGLNSEHLQVQTHPRQLRTAGALGLGMASAVGDVAAGDAASGNPCSPSCPPPHHGEQGVRMAPNGEIKRSLSALFVFT